MFSKLTQLASKAQFYDADNRLTNMVDVTGTNSFTYTPVGQLASETGPWPDDTVSYLYSQMLRTNLTITEPSGSWAQGYAYDNAWRLQTLDTPMGNFGYTYNGGASPLVAGISLPNGANIVNSFDALGRLKETDLKNQSGQILDGYTYTLDPLGLRTNIVRNFGLMNSSVAVGYDNIGQITSWIGQEANGTARLNEQLGFGYDAADNLHLRTNNALVQTFTVDAANELTDVSRTGTLTVSGNTPEPTSSLTVNGQQAQTNADFTFASPGHSLNNGLNTFTNVARNMYGVLVTNVTSSYLPTSISLLYDQNGNLTSDGTHSYAYNAENELTNVSVAGQWQTAFVYDGLGRRRIEIDSAWQNGQWVVTNEIRYLYDGYLPIQERDTNNNVLVTYTRGLDLSGTLQDAGGIGGLLARTDSNGSTFYHADGSGNVTALMDGNGYIVARYMYNPFGKLLGEWESMADANEMRFSSMIQRDNLSLYPFRAYHANLQRWLNEDPIQERGGINLYSFVGNDPINYIDYSGKQAAIAAGLLIVFVAGQVAETLNEGNPEQNPVFGEYNPPLQPNLPPPLPPLPWEKEPNWMKTEDLVSKAAKNLFKDNSPCHNSGTQSNNLKRGHGVSSHDEWPSIEVPPRQTMPRRPGNNEEPTEPPPYVPPVGLPRQNGPGRAGGPSEGRTIYEFPYYVPQTNGDNYVRFAVRRFQTASRQLF